MKSIENAKKKTNRRYGANLWGDPKSPLNKREYAPGQHGQRRKKMTDYGEQLYAKQKLKTYYGNVNEKQFHKYYVEAVRRGGDSAENLVGILESRLDNLVYKAKFVPTIFASRQFVNHGHVTVNGKRVDIPSYLVKPGEVISLRESSRNADRMKDIVERNSNRLVPKWIDMNKDTLEGKIIALADREDIDFPVEEHLIVEYYSK